MSESAARSCHVCTALATAPPERIVHHDEHWTALITGEVPGWVMFAANRHAEWLWDMSAGEQAGLGPLLAKLSSALRVAAGAERVYFVGLGENSIHCHGLLLSRLDDDMTIERAVHGVLGEVRGARQDGEGAARLALALREQLAVVI